LFKKEIIKTIFLSIVCCHLLGLIHLLMIWKIKLSNMSQIAIQIIIKKLNVCQALHLLKYLENYFYSIPSVKLNNQDLNINLLFLIKILLYFYKTFKLMPTKSYIKIKKLKKLSINNQSINSNLFNSSIFSQQCKAFILMTQIKLKD
jgi:hypothetical protein